MSVTDWQARELAGQILASMRGSSSISSFVMGAVTPTSFGLGFDVSNASDTVDVRLYSNSQKTALVATASPISPLTQAGVTNNYYRWMGGFTGLSPATTYYGDIVLNGKTDPVGFQITTFPAAGVAANLKFAFGSCSTAYTASAPSRIYTGILNDQPAFLLHMGDLGYSDVSVNDIRVNRTFGARGVLNNPNLATLLRKVPLIYMWDDHDTGDNDNHYDTVYVSGATNSQIIANAFAVYGELFPHYDFVHAGLLSQIFDYGKVRFIIPDFRTQRRYLVGTPTSLGDGTNPPGSWDQKTWLLNTALPGVDTASAHFGFLVSSTTWTGAVFDGYRAIAPVEQVAVCDALRGLATPMMVVCGNSHQGGFDDGTNNNFSSHGDLIAPVILSSPFDQTDVFTKDGPFTVNGVSKVFQNRSNLYCLMQMTDDGVNPISWQATMKTNPISIDPGDIGVSLGAFTSADTAPNIVSVPVISISTAALSVQVSRTGFGPTGPCSVLVSIPELSYSQQLSFKPNRNTLDIPVTVPGGTTLVTVNLSNPVGCQLGANTSCTVHILGSILQETADYISQFTSYPGDSFVGYVDTLFSGIKTDSDWDHLKHLHLMGPSQQGMLVDARSPKSGPAVLHGSMTFTANRKIAGDGSTGYIATPFLANTLSVNDHSWGMWVIDSVVSTKGDMGDAADNYLNVHRTSTPSNTSRLRDGSTTSSDITNSTGTGFFHVQRNDPASYNVYLNGSLLSNVVAASSAMDNSPFTMGAWAPLSGTPQFSTRGFAVAFFGDSSLSQANFYARIHAFLVSLGATT